jgi:hypothetical protein
MSATGFLDMGLFVGDIAAEVAVSSGLPYSYFPPASAVTGGSTGAECRNEDSILLLRRRLRHAQIDQHNKIRAMTQPTAIPTIAPIGTRIVLVRSEIGFDPDVAVGLEYPDFVCCPFPVLVAKELSAS